MKTIVFNEAPTDLMDAVLAGQKTMTRRLVPINQVSAYEKYRKKNPETKLTIGEWLIKNGYSKFTVGEEVAISESYKSIGLSPNLTIIPKRGNKPVKISEQAGWTNKLYVSASLMRHHIRITSIRVERIQDITKDEYSCEGIFKIGHDDDKDLDLFGTSRHNQEPLGYSERHAFQNLTKKIGTESSWSDNPWVYVIGFVLLD